MRREANRKNGEGASPNVYPFTITFVTYTRGRNLRHDHVLITDNENNLRPDKKISYISGLTRPN